MTKERLEKVFNILEEEGYMPEYLYLDFFDKDFIGIRIDKRLSKVDEAIINKSCGELDFFELRNSDYDNFWICGLKRHVLVNFDSTFLIEKGELKITDEEEWEVKNYDLVNILENYVED